MYWRQSVVDLAGTAGSDAGVTSPDEALVGRAVLCTPNERCQGRRFVCVGTARTHSTPLRAGCDAPYLFANADVSDYNCPFLARGLIALEQTRSRHTVERCSHGPVGRRCENYS